MQLVVAGVLVWIAHLGHWRVASERPTGTREDVGTTAQQAASVGPGLAPHNSSSSAALSRSTSSALAETNETETERKQEQSKQQAVYLHQRGQLSKVSPSLSMSQHEGQGHDKTSARALMSARAEPTKTGSEGLDNLDKTVKRKKKSKDGKDDDSKDGKDGKDGKEGEDAREDGGPDQLDGQELQAFQEEYKPLDAPDNLGQDVGQDLSAGLPLAEQLHNDEMAEQAHTIYHPPPDAVHYGRYVKAAKKVKDALEDIEKHVTETMDESAHVAAMKSMKYGYGLDGLRHNIRNLETSVDSYKQRLHDTFREQTYTYDEALRGGQLWDQDDFHKRLPEGELWQEPMIQALAAEPQEDFSYGARTESARSKYRRYALSTNIGNASVNEFIHPQANNVYKDGYSHGYKNASEHKEHGVEATLQPAEIEPMAYDWTPSGVTWASQYFRGSQERHAPKNRGWLTREQKKVLEEGDLQFEPDDAVKLGYLGKAMDADVLPYTWTMNGHLWAMENGLFPGPPPSVHAWVTIEQLRAMASSIRQGPSIEVKPEGVNTCSREAESTCHDLAESAHRMGLFKGMETDANGRPKPWERQTLVNREHDLPAGYQMWGDNGALGGGGNVTENPLEGQAGGALGARPAEPGMGIRPPDYNVAHHMSSHAHRMESPGMTQVVHHGARPHRPPGTMPLHVQSPGTGGRPGTPVLPMS